MFGNTQRPAKLYFLSLYCRLKLLYNTRKTYIQSAISKALQITLFLPQIVWNFIFLHHSPYVHTLTTQCLVRNSPSQEEQSYIMFFIPHYYLFSLTPPLLYSLFPKHKHQEADCLHLEAERARVTADLFKAKWFHLPHSVPGQYIHLQKGSP